MRTEVVLVRHAQARIPRPGGPDDFHRSLTEHGLLQAERLCRDLCQITPGVIASSPYLRATQTVEPFAHTVGLPIQTVQDLREWDSGLEPTPDYARHYAAIWASPHTARTGAESLDQLTRRATTAIRSLAQEHLGQTITVSTHGTFISRALVGFGLTKVDWPFSRGMPMPAIYRLSITDENVHAAGPGL